MPKNSDGIILQLYARTPAPLRDYCGLTITNDSIILNIWNITYGPHVYPKRQTCLLEDLAGNKYLKWDIGRIFGEHVLEYANSLSKNEKKIENLSTKAFLSILNYLAARDIVNLSQTSKIMFERCNDDNIWSLMFRKLFKCSPSHHDLDVVEQCGWRKVIKEKKSIKPSKGTKTNLKNNCAVIKSRKSGNATSVDIVKSVTNVALTKTLKNNQTKSAVNLFSNRNTTSRTLVQVKNDLKPNAKITEIEVKNSQKNTKINNKATPLKIVNRKVSEKNVKKN